MPDGGALVFHPDTQHSYQTALGLQKAGLLDRFVTGIYYRPTASTARLLDLLPGTLGARMRAYARRRHMPGLDDKLVEVHPVLGALPRLTARLPASPRFRAGLVRRERNLFEAAAAAAIRRRRPHGVICYDTNALAALRAARAVGAHAIMDQTIGHLAIGNKLLAEEAALHPDFADSIDHDEPPGNIERCRAEALAADWILAPSDYVRRSLLEVGVPAERIVMLPYGADAERFAPASAAEIPPGRFRVLFVGAVSQRKGVKYLLDAMRRLALPGAELVLVGGIVGSGRGLLPYRGLFRHVPQLPRDAVAAQYRNSDIFVLPSLHEGSAIAAFEALASGLPVIATPNTGTVVRDGTDGFLVPIRDVEALMARIERLYRERELRRAMGEAARARALDFTWARYHERLAAWFRALPGRE